MMGLVSRESCRRGGDVRGARLALAVVLLGLGMLGGACGNLSYYECGSSFVAVSGRSASLHSVPCMPDPETARLEADRRKQRAEREAAAREAAAREAAAREAAARMRDEPTAAGIGEPRRRAGQEQAPPGAILASADRRTPGRTGNTPAPQTRVAQAPGATCREVVIRLPTTIEFHGDQGTVIGVVETNLGPGTYKISYKAGQFIVTPWPTRKQVLDVSMRSRIGLYTAYLKSMKQQPVPLRVEGTSAPATKRKSASNANSTSASNANSKSATESCPDCRQVEGLSADEAMQVMKALGASKRERSWMDFAGTLAGRKQLSADDVRRLLGEHRRRMGVRDAPARTTTEVVERSKVEAWSDLDEWEQKLWREYLGKYGHTADVTGADGFHITKNVRLSMALRMVPKYVKPGAREAWDALVNDPVFIGATAFGITAYFALWLAPEPLVTKIGAALTTIGIVTMAGCSVAEIMALGRAWLRLRDEAAKATTLAQLEAAAERFGKALGDTALRIVLALATAVSGKLLPATMPRPLPSGGPPPAAALPGGGTFVLGTTTPARTIKILKGGIAVFMAPPAMSTLSGGNKARGSGKAGGGRKTGRRDGSKAKSDGSKATAERDVAWSSHGGKHAASHNIPWNKVVQSTKSGPAKYKPGANIEALERRVWAEGMPTTNGRNWRVMEFADEIGASRGMSSRWVRVEESAGTIHGHPITHDEFINLTR